MDRPWLLIVLALACTLIFPEMGVVATTGGALYAHRIGAITVRNVLFAFFVVLLLVLAVLAPPT